MEENELSDKNRGHKVNRHSIVSREVFCYNDYAKQFVQKKEGQEE